MTKEEIASYIDHTLLSPEAGVKEISKLCSEAISYKFASVCVNPCYVGYAAAALEGTGVNLRKAWEIAQNWFVGRYTIMPDHTHFFCAPGCYPFSGFHQWIRCWKGLAAKLFWNTPTGKNVLASMHWNENVRKPPLWQRDCWDRQLRSGESYDEKWNYVRNNPVLAGFVEKAEDWKYQGELHTLIWME